MRILIISNMYPSDEKPYAGIFVKNQFEEIQKILDPKDSIEIYYMKRQFTSKLGSIIKYFKALLRFAPYLFKKYDVVHLHFFYPLIYLVWIYTKFHPNTKVVVTFHGLDITEKVNNSNIKILRKIAQKVNFSIPVGTTLAKMVKEKLNLQIGKIIPVGVNNNVFYKDPEIKKKYDFIFVGSFIERKGIDTVIEAIKGLRNKSISYCFCGSGKYIDEINSLQVSNSVVIKKNQTQEQLRRLLNQSKFLLLMSRNEGFPTATIEAMYCGVPVITSDIPQFKEQVKHGKNGYTIPLANVEALKNKILFLKDIPQSQYNKLSNDSMNSFKELSLKNVCNEIVSIYKNLSI